MSTSTVVIGAQWGDEGKGKVTDVVAESVNAVTRFSGGPNAGHTLSVNGRTVVLHILPSALFRRDVLKLVGPGVVCDPEVLSEELRLAEELDALHTVHLDLHAPLILPIHRELDILTGVEKIRVAIAYGAPLEEVDPHRTLDTELLERVEPVYQDMDGWQEDLNSCSSIKDLPSNAKKLLWKIEEQTDLPIMGVSVGPGREDMIWKE